MKANLIIATLAFFCSVSAFAQQPGDTITVNSWNWSQTDFGSGIRDTMVNFPNDPTVTYEKVLMSYNMRCKGGGVNTGGGNNVACGEWDYSCNTYVHDSSRVDSLISTHPDFIISDFSGATYNYTSQPLYDFYQYTQQNVVLNNIISENQYAITTGTVPVPNALAGTNNSGKAQFMYTAAELTGAGFAVGNIDGFLVNATNGGQVNFLRVNIKETTAPSLDPANPELSGFTEVFFSDYTFATGQNRIQFHTPYVWNGTDNIIIELSFTNTVGTNNVVLEGAAASGMAIHGNNGYHVDLSGNGHFDVPTSAMGSITDEITVSFWAYGNENILPVNTSIIEATGAGGERDVNIHLPWSNGQLYWDCGGENGYDRINQPMTAGEMAGQWNHWAMTKNAITGIMEVYHNGTLWHSGTGKTRPIDIANMVIGKSWNYTNNWKGKVDEVRIWNKALTSTDIQNWMNVPIDNSHPEYASLVAYYNMDEGTGTSINDNSVNALVATGNNSVLWNFDRGIDLDKFFIADGERPAVTLVQGNYDTSVNPTNVLDSVLLVPNSVTEYTVASNSGTVMDDDINVVATNSYWEAVPENIYDGATGALLSTIPVTAEGSITPVDMNYWRRWPMKFEIMSFVTPYGIGLNLGPDGKTWMFDVTDFLPILKGSKRMTMERGGQHQEDMDIKFHFIVGTPARDVVDIQSLWRTESRGYTSIVNDQYFPARDVVMNPNATAYKVRTTITGHGQEGEFIPRDHFVDIDGGANEFQWQVWTECGENPIYPQGGTWIYDRAGWCPGAPTDLNEFDITNLVSPGAMHNFDYGMTGASGTSNYIVSNQLVSYGGANHTLDVSITDIINPSNYVEYERINAICKTPTVEIQNTGSTTLTEATIEYWVNGSTTPQTFTWNGSLDFLEKTTVELPTPSDLWNDLTGTGTNTFHARVSAPNGGSDEYVHNNTFKTEFTVPDVVPSHFWIEFRTNNAASESSYELLDDAGNTLLFRNGMTNSTTYRDTFQLGYGCYQLNIYDGDDDGIDFWANNDGTGFARIRQVGAGVVKTFEGDFGGSLQYNFTIDYPLAYEELHDTYVVELYPNPASDKFVLSAGSISEARIELINQLGQTVEVPMNVSLDEITFDTSELPSGIYLVKVDYRGKLITKKVIIE
ncbi:MAG: T9SS type A sorting domain-containing protein [bacterium]|nr:T9SS type A sorting domain-containing protein [bacterium]